jgi:hypothetical protein
MMVAERKVVVVDIDEKAELVHLVDEVRAAGGETVLRWNGEEVAVVRTLKHSRLRRQRQRTEADVEAFRASAGGWRGIVDEAFMEEVYRSRSVSSRPSVDLWYQLRLITSATEPRLRSKRATAGALADAG